MTTVYVLETINQSLLPSVDKTWLENKNTKNIQKDNILIEMENMRKIDKQPEYHFLTYLVSNKNIYSQYCYLRVI